MNTNWLSLLKWWWFYTIQWRSSGECFSSIKHTFGSRLFRLKAFLYMMILKHQQDRHNSYDIQTRSFLFLQVWWCVWHEENCLCSMNYLWTEHQPNYKFLFSITKLTLLTLYTWWAYFAMHIKKKDDAMLTMYPSKQMSSSCHEKQKTKKKLHLLWDFFIELMTSFRSFICMEAKSSKFMSTFWLHECLKASSLQLALHDWSWEMQTTVPLENKDGWK